MTSILVTSLTAVYHASFPPSRQYLRWYLQKHPHLSAGAIAVNKVQVAAVLGRDTVEVFKLPDVVCGHPAVLPCCGVPVHAALVIAAKQALQIELKEPLIKSKNLILRHNDAILRQRIP